MRFSRPICFLLAVLTILTSVFLGCSGGAKPDAETAKTTEKPSVTDEITSAPAPETEPTDPDTVHDLPADLDFDGAEFVMYVARGYWAPPFPTDDEPNGDVLHDTEYDTVVYAEELLGVKIRQIVGGDGYLGNTSALDYWMTGEEEVEVWLELDRFAYRDALENLFIPLDELKYIDTSKKYWYSDQIELLAFGDFELMTLGSFDYKSFTDAGCLFMNLAVADDIHVEVPYDLVDEGKWTFDALAKYKGVYSRDLDGDNRLTHEDQTTFGSTHHFKTALNFLAAAEVPIMGKDADNLPCFTCFGSEKFLDVMTYVKNLFFDPLDTVMTGKQDDDTMQTTDMFAKDKNLIITANIGDMMDLREMDSPYAVLPIPKWDEAQEKYSCYLEEPRFAMVSSYVKDPDMVGAVLEALSAYGYQHLIPTLIETCLQFKYNNDPKSVKNIRLAFDSRAIALSQMMSEILQDGHITDPLVQDKSFATWLASVQDKAEKALENDLDDIRAIVKELGK